VSRYLVVMIVWRKEEQDQELAGKILWKPTRVSYLAKTGSHRVVTFY